MTVTRILITALFLHTLLGSCTAPKIGGNEQAQNLSSQPPAKVNAQASIQASPSPSTVNIAYSEVFRITYASCLPCHNRHTLPQVIERVKAGTFDSVDGEERLRILNELEGLKKRQDEGSALGFSSGQEELMNLFESIPGGFYIMLEKGVMPPPWAPDLMEAIDWPNYERLSIENRIKLLQFAKPHSKRYLG
jgi:hypothetical protein